MKFLIVVPTLNSHKLLNNLVNSIQNQDYPNLRVLFVDGESSIVHKSWIKNICSNNKKFSYLRQDNNEKGIYGAMNVGFKNALIDEWILFWGSDDWAYSNNIFTEINNTTKNFLKNKNNLDLIICKAQYIDRDTGSEGRRSVFSYASYSKLIDGAQFRLNLKKGHIPAHQSVIFGPNMRSKVNFYNTNYDLAADLEYFLRISKFRFINIALLDKTIVYIGTNGISGKSTFKRLKEVIICYYKEFKFSFLTIIFIRYLRKIMSFIKAKL